MTAKKRRMKLGKVIRRETGLPLPVCMTAAKMIDRDKGEELQWTAATEEFVQSIKCGDGCCCFGRELVGPRGSYRFARY